MKLSRISALLTAGALTFSLLSCTDNNEPRQSRVRDSEREFAIGHSAVTEYDTDIPTGCPDIDEAEGYVLQLINDINGVNEESVSEDISCLLSLYNNMYEVYAYKELQFYANYSDDDTEEEYNELYRRLYVTGDMIRYAFVCGYNSDYQELFRPLVTEDDLDLYGDLGEYYDLKLARMESEESFDDMTEDLGEYYDIIADDSLSDDEKDLECAEILINILKDYDTESLYSQYDMDYTGEDILALGAPVRDELIPVMDDLIDTYVDNYVWDDTDSYYGSAPFETIREYAPLLSEDIGRSAEIICDKKLYRICSNDDAFEGAFTEELPATGDAVVFIGSVSEDEILSTAIHEFGHFHASVRDDTPAYLARNNLDIAEVQSQGLELIFTRFYDDIYGKSGDSERIMQAIDLLDAVISGYLVGEFEYRAVKDIDSMTPEKLVELFNETVSYYEGALKLNMVSHLFESPGYYISYSTSALAAFDLFGDVANAPDKALERYEKISAISCNSGEYKFREALSACGFRDVLSRDYITDLAQELKEFNSKYSK